MLNSFFNIVRYYGQLLISKRPKSQLVEIDLENQIFVIHSSGISSPIKFSFNQFVDDKTIIKSLSSIHASYAGYYYGLYYGAQNNHLNNFDIIDDSSCSRFVILTQNRNNEITFLDKFTKNKYTHSILKILTTKKIIENFDSMQSCYLGILAGIYSSKLIKQKSVISGCQKPFLYVV